MNDERLTTWIKVRLKNWIENTISIGLGLQEKQAQYKYRREGEGFVAYLKREFDMSQRSAYNFIECARVFATVANISPDAAWELAARGNAEDRAEAVKRAEAGEVIDKAKAEQIIDARKKRLESMLKNDEKARSHPVPSWAKGYGGP